MTEKEFLEKLSRDLTDQGKLIEAGWIGCRLAWIPRDAPEVQISEMRKAFFAGAQHIFASLFAILELGEEATANDLKRMDQIDAELKAFVATLKPMPNRN